MKNSPAPLGLYVHIPFCRSKCIYCDFYSLPGPTGAGMRRYARALQAHLEQGGQSFGGYQVDTVYIGGGTPTLLPDGLLLDILGTVRRSWRLADTAEVTVEANPESAQDWRALRRLRRAGVNRLSLGVQAADDAVLKTIGRIHTWADAVAAVAAARRAGIGNVSVDLIYGLPGQSAEGFLAGLDRAFTLEADHISCYGLKVEEGTPLAARAGELALPDDDAQADMYLAAVERLAAAGYGQYEISNFARPDRFSRHNMKYWTLQEYAGFGPGAHSDVGGVRSAYARDLAAYVQGVEKGTLQLAEAERIPLLQRDTEYIMLSLRTAQGISRRTFAQRYRRRFAPLEPAFRRYEALGLAQPTEEGWRLTAKGFLLSNTIITELWEIHGREKLRREEAAARGDFRAALE